MTHAALSRLTDAAASLRDAAQQLRGRLPADGPPRFLTGCEQMVVRAQQLCDEVTDLAGLDLRDSKVRHGLRSHLALVIAQCGILAVRSV